MQVVFEISTEFCVTKCVNILGSEEVFVFFYKLEDKLNFVINCNISTACKTFAETAEEHNLITEWRCNTKNVMSQKFNLKEHTLLTAFHDKVLIQVGCHVFPLQTQLVT